MNRYQILIKELNEDNLKKALLPRQISSPSSLRWLTEPQPIASALGIRNSG